MSGQKIEFGIQYTPLQFSGLSFDRDYMIFDNYTSSKLNVPGMKLTLPSLSNSGLFLRFPLKKIVLQTGLGFQNNVYNYSVSTTYSDSYDVFFYSSIDVPVFLSYTFRSSGKLKFRCLAGVNTKMFKIKRSYYSVFAKALDPYAYAEDYENISQKRDFIVSKVNPFMLYSRVGAGIKYYNISMDICADRNITNMNRMQDHYNANFKDSYLVTVVFGFQIANKDLKISKEQSKISKE